MKDQILEYLSLGIKPAQVVTIVGCTAAYISQLLKDEDFRAQLEERLGKPTEETAGEKRLDAKYEALEHTLLENMQNALANAELRDITAALKVVGERQNQRRIQKNPALAQPATQINVVSLTLPAYKTRPEPVIEMNSKQEVIAIGDVALAPMNADGVKSLFARLKGQNEQAFAQIPDASDFGSNASKAA